MADQFLPTNRDMRKIFGLTILSFLCHIKYFILALAFLAIVFTSCEKPKIEFTLPEGAKAIVCLTYDDGMETHLSNAIPQLDSVGLKGTFYINSVVAKSDVVRWMRAAGGGHELGNHSIFHPCPKALGWPEELVTENYSVDRMIKEISATASVLDLLDPERKIRSYAYPCNNTMVGGIEYINELKQSGLVRYARGGGSQDTCIVTNFKTVNEMLVPSYIVAEGSTVNDLIKMVEKAKQMNGLIVFQFHGVGGQWISVSNDVHRQFVNYLKQNEEELYVTTFSGAMDLITHR
jgi:peptidoglycan/xylan/chitin deacetylase (PgdA/CDA1 family)